MSTDANGTNDPESPRSHYERQIQNQLSSVSQVARKKQTVSRSRSAVLAVWLLLFVLAINGIISSTVAWILAVVAFTGLLILAAWDERLAKQIGLSNERAEVAKTQLARLDRDWTQIPEFDVAAPDEIKQASADLDLFGHASLYQLICRAHTPLGGALLRDWLAFGTTPDVAKQRNEAAAKLAPLRDYREQLDLRGRLLRSSGAGPEAFVQWAEGERWLEKRPWLLSLSRVLLVLGIATVPLAILGFYPSIMLLTLAVVLAINLLLSVVWAGRVHDIFEMVDSRQNDVVHYCELLDLFEQLPNEPKLLDDLRRQMGEDTSRPQRALNRLAGIMRFAQMRHSGMFGIFHLIFQLLFLIDFHVLGVLENWHRTYGDQVSGWFVSVAELEAIASLASLVHDNPEWTFANYHSSNERIAAQSFGHPLMATPVCNDVSLGPAGTFLLVTGSNMSGKSTLLRTIGLNCVLAQAGAPVRADSFSLPPVEIATSMRIQDSLEDGVSFFMAELKRLKQIVDQAESLGTQSDRTMLFLLDEILQGTNSAERHIAVTRVVKQLTDSGATGAISTHDLELAHNDELSGISTDVHFRETISDGDGMTFDYKMRDGVATTTNALKLLELVGISKRER